MSGKPAPIRTRRWPSFARRSPNITRWRSKDRHLRHGGGMSCRHAVSAIAASGADMNRAAMDRFIDTIEWIAAGFVGIVALNIFISVILRNTLNYAIPDSFDIGRMLLG